ncbi:MAG: indolepyruvate oxidoreductase subunit beta [Candidatus Heimdallarchaeota archaeon]|nr:indolepyruvate oxidoreductase subunit beta [Candidatus Heimdallarchaeota archaeon]
MVDTYQMVICGVGGQGILTISDILTIAAQTKGLHVLGSEVHGMAQKGGSVVTNLKIGEELNSPTIPVGTGKVLVGLEQNETLRYIKYVKPGGTVITSETVLFPISWKKDKAAADKAREKIREDLDKFEARVYFDAEGLANEAGLSLAQNTVLLGALSQVEGFPITEDELRDALKIRVPAKYLDSNLRAFELGKNAVKKNI